MLNSNPSAHLVKYCRFKRNSCDLKKSDSQYPNWIGPEVQNPEFVKGCSTYTDLWLFFHHFSQLFTTWGSNSQSHFLDKASGVLNFFFVSLFCIYKFSTPAKLNYSNLLLFDLLLFGQVATSAAVLITLGQFLFSTSSRNPFLILQLDKTSSFSESIYWISGFWGKQLLFLLTPVSFVYVYRVSFKLYHHVSHDNKDYYRPSYLGPHALRKVLAGIG